jgi:hypothetical protein
MQIVQLIGTAGYFFNKFLIWFMPKPLMGSIFFIIKQYNLYNQIIGQKNIFRICPEISAQNYKFCRLNLRQPFIYMVGLLIKNSNKFSNNSNKFFRKINQE